MNGLTFSSWFSHNYLIKWVSRVPHPSDRPLLLASIFSERMLDWLGNSKVYGLNARKLEQPMLSIENQTVGLREFYANQATHAYNELDFQLAEKLFKQAL